MKQNDSNWFCYDHNRQVVITVSPEVNLQFCVCVCVLFN